MKIDRNKVFAKYDNRCGYCGIQFKTIKDMQVDHIEPKWRGFDIGNIVYSEKNLMPSCRMCNHYKRGDNLEQFRQKMKTLHERVCSHYIGKVALGYGIVNIVPFSGVFYFEKFNKDEVK